ncbi:MAG: CHASE2 domain-containing protein [Nitrospirae bacterium]|nr:CHASE2 domain-containing protein [Nitrospirota bacterium]
MKKRFLKISLIIIIGYAFIIFADYLGFFEGINNYLYDLSFRLRGSIKHDERILIVAIDEKTLSELGRWPLKRSYYSNLLNSLSEASAIGFDIIFSESSEDDLSLAESIKRLGKVVLPIYISKSGEITRPSEVFSFAKTGHVHVEPYTDGITRKVFHHIIYRNTNLYSFASVIYNIIIGKESNSQFHNAKDDIFYNKIFQTNSMNINFYGPSGTFKHISFVDIIKNRYEKDFFRNKIVLVGLTASGLEERIIVPFTQQRDTISGVEIHANILNNLLDKIL